MKNPWVILGANLFAFSVCFAAWVMNGVLIAFLINQNIYSWNNTQIGWLLGLPILTGSLIRLPLGILTDKFGARIIFTLLLFLSALGLWCVSLANSYLEFIFASLLFGAAGGSFAVGVASVAVWFKKNMQGTALGIFGGGNLGAALTTLFAPTLLLTFTDYGKNPDGWRHLPELYAIILIGTGVLYFLLTTQKLNEEKKSFVQLLKPLCLLKTYRFSFFYLLFFGSFVALTQWMVFYYMNSYHQHIALAGFLTSCFSIPSALARVVGGRLADVYGTKKILNFTFIASLILLALLSVPRASISTPEKGIFSLSNGVVSSVTESSITVTNDQGKPTTYPLKTRPPETKKSFHLLPTKTSWQTAVIKQGETVTKNQLLAKGTTEIVFEAELFIFVALVVLLGFVFGVGMAAVFKGVAETFPGEVGVVGGTVGMLGSLGGFFAPVIFGSILGWSGFWTSCWIFLLILFFIALRIHKWEK